MARRLTRKEAEIVKKLDDVQLTKSYDAEYAHGDADDWILSVVHPEVAAAYERLKDRCPWWKEG